MRIFNCKYESEYKGLSRAIISKLTGVGTTFLLTEENTPFDVAKYSAMFPGWGQFNNGQEIKGAIIAIVEVGALTGAVLTYLQYNQAVVDYDAAPAGSDFGGMAEHIQYLNNLNKNYLYCALGIWVYGVLDPFIFGINSNRRFTMDYKNDKIQLAYLVKF